MSSLAPIRTLARIVHARKAWRLLFVMLLGAVCYLAFTPTPPQVTGNWWDKANHAAAFASLTFTAALAFPKPRLRLSLFLVMAGMLAFGAFIELVQVFVPGRSGEWQDLLADGVGIAAGMLAALIARIASNAQH